MLALFLETGWRFGETSVLYVYVMGGGVGFSVAPAKNGSCVCVGVVTCQIGGIQDLWGL
jgi:hypothetical protein